MASKQTHEWRLLPPPNAISINVNLLAQTLWKTNQTTFSHVENKVLCCFCFLHILSTAVAIYLGTVKSCNCKLPENWNWQENLFRKGNYKTALFSQNNRTTYHFRVSESVLFPLRPCFWRTCFSPLVRCALSVTWSNTADMHLGLQGNWLHPAATWL